MDNEALAAFQETANAAVDQMFPNIPEEERVALIAQLIVFEEEAFAKYGVLRAMSLSQLLIFRFKESLGGQDHD